MCSMGLTYFIRTNAGNKSVPGVYNIGLRSIALRNLRSGVANMITGYTARPNINSGQNNVGSGYNSLALCTTGTSNNAVGLWIH